MLGTIIMQERSKRMSVSESTGRTRKKRNLTEAERSQISQFHREHPLVTHNNIASIFGVERSTVSKILQNQYSAQLASANSNTLPDISGDQIRGHRPSTSGDEELKAWAQAAQRLGIPLTREILRKQAAILAAASWKTQQEPAGSTPPGTTTSSGSTSSSASPPVTSHGADISGSDNTGVITWNWEQFLDADLSGNGGGNGDATAFQLQPAAGCMPSFVSDPDIGPFGEAGYTALETVFPGCGSDGTTSTGPPSSSIGAELDYSSSNQHSVAGSVLNSPRISGLDQAYAFGTAPASTSGNGGECAPVCPMHKDALLTRDHVMRDHSRDTELISLYDARRAFSIVEKNISGLPDLTALDQLCLNHVRSRLGP